MDDGGGGDTTLAPVGVAVAVAAISIHSSRYRSPGRATDRRRPDGVAVGATSGVATSAVSASKAWSLRGRASGSQPLCSGLPSGAAPIRSAARARTRSLLRPVSTAVGFVERDTERDTE